jgi:hypothetical protein
MDWKYERHRWTSQYRSGRSVRLFTTPRSFSRDTLGITALQDLARMMLLNN